jgi:hypothetical protein
VAGGRILGGVAAVAGVVVVVVRQHLVHAHQVGHHRFLVDDGGLQFRGVSFLRNLFLKCFRKNGDFGTKVMAKIELNIELKEECKLFVENS